MWLGAKIRVLVKGPKCSLQCSESTLQGFHLASTYSRLYGRRFEEDRYFFLVLQLRDSVDLVSISQSTGGLSRHVGAPKQPGQDSSCNNGGRNSSFGGQAASLPARPLVCGLGFMLQEPCEPAALCRSSFLVIVEAS